MKSVWREARHLSGYRHAFPYQLLVEIAGRPYVDVRCSFNSFLPATLRPELCEKLVNHYLDRLRAHPEFHDKIEFEIVLSSLDFTFEKHAWRLEEAGCEGAAAIAEHSRLSLVPAHPALVRFSALSGRFTDPVQDAAEVTAAVGTWIGEMVGAAAPAQGLDPSRLMADLTRARRHSFQSAGLFQAVPWSVEW